MTRHPAIPLFGALVVLCSLCWPAGLPATAAEPATGRAAAASSTGNVAARVGVRSGEHPTFTRLVFDWTVPVQYTVESADGQVRVQFDRSAELAIDRIVARPPEGLSGFGQSRDGDGRTTFGFTADGRIRHFRDGTKVVVDVMKAPEKAAGAPAGPVASAVSPAAAAPADQLRAEIYWRARDWKGAAAMLSRLVGPAPAEGVPFSEKDARAVMNNAVALALTGDSGEKLSQLRSAFGTAMEGTPFAADFRVIAAADRSSRDFDSVLQRAASIEDFDAFLKSYRARLLEPQKVSAAGSNGASG